MKGFNFTIFRKGLPITVSANPEALDIISNKIISTIEKEIDGRLPHKHVIVPYVISCISQPKTFLEIGTYNGGSMMLFTSLPLKCKFVSIDLFQDNAHYKVSKEQSLKNIQKVNNGQSIDLLKGHSTEPKIVANVKELFPNGIDFIFIDGDHSTKQVVKDFETYFPLLNNEAIIVFDDYYINCHKGAVITAVHNIIAKYRNQLHVVGNIGFNDTSNPEKHNFEFVLQKI